jgi:hypothetical protein
MARSAALRFAFAIGLLSFLAARPAGAEILLGNTAGNAWDPLVGANPFFVFPGETQFRGVSVGNNPFAAPLTGPVRLSVDCCVDHVTRTPVPASLTVRMVLQQCRLLDLTAGRPPGRPPVEVTAGSQLELALPVCPAEGSVTVNVGPATSAQAFVLAAATTAAPPGRYIATVLAESALGTSTMEMYVSVVPGSWLADGPAPACPPPTLVIPLSAIKPPPYVWKRTSPAATSYPIGMAFQTGAPGGGGGMVVTLADAGGTGPIPIDRTVVRFTNTRGWPVAMRTVDSRSCGTAGQQIVVAQGETKTLTFNAGNTTTLVFSKSTCRAFVDLFDCWGHSALGLDDLVAFSEGPFWALLGGRRVDIETAGDWGTIPRPDSVAVIQTP